MKMSHISVGFAAMVAAGVTSGQALAGKCVKASASATAITSPVAGELARIALSSSLATSGLKGRGAVKVKCKYEFVLSTCTASQRACK